MELCHSTIIIVVISTFKSYLAVIISFLYLSPPLCQCIYDMLANRCLCKEFGGTGWEELLNQIVKLLHILLIPPENGQIISRPCQLCGLADLVPPKIIN